MFFSQQTEAFRFNVFSVGISGFKIARYFAAVSEEKRDQGLPHPHGPQPPSAAPEALPCGTEGGAWLCLGRVAGGMGRWVGGNEGRPGDCGTMAHGAYMLGGRLSKINPHRAWAARHLLGFASERVNSKEEGQTVIAFALWLAN